MAIPKKVKQELLSRGGMDRCHLEGEDCSGGIEWHHHLKFQGRKVEKAFCIISLCTYHHAKADRKDIKELLDWIMLSRASDEDIEYYSKAVDLRSYKEALDKKFGNFTVKNG